MTTRDRPLDPFLAEAVRLTRPFYDTLRPYWFFLASYVVGSYLVFQTVFNDLTGRYPLCTSSPTCSFPSAAVLLFAIILLELATLKRLKDLRMRRVSVEE